MKRFILSLIICTTALAVDKQTFSNLDAANQLPNTFTWPVNDPGSPFGITSAAEQATTFVPTVSGSLSEIWLPFGRASYSPSKSTRTISLNTDAAGWPGTVIESWVFTPQSGVKIIEKLKSVKCPLLKAGTTYWLIAHVNLVGQGVDYWPKNDQGKKALMTNRRDPAGAWFKPYVAEGPAFRVLVGDAASPPVVTPPVTPAPPVTPPVVTPPAPPVTPPAPPVTPPSTPAIPAPVTPPVVAPPAPQTPVSPPPTALDEIVSLLKQALAKLEAMKKG